MNDKKYTVRIVRPLNKPYLSKPKIRKIKNKTKPSLNILIGSTLGGLSGIAIFTMLKFMGIDFGGVESSLIIGLPAFLGLITSVVVF